ncbi:hypothetical protein B0H12DRAFT_1232779 [Mycena haematopus]|nr:hypothetical protein B0H12DRAFT_1232779 [Mycena haematopus]
MSPDVSSILSFPPEITAIIFTHSLPTRSPPLSFESCPSPSPKVAPLLLAQICSQWRAICLGTPHLWASNIAFEHGATELLELWLSRTETHPLTISLRTTDSQRASKFMQLTIAHTPQWQDIHLVLPLPALRQLSAASPFPRLTRLSLCAVGPDEWAYAPPITIRDTPLLRHACIHFLPQIDLHLAQLTTLHFHASLGVPQTVAILRRCPRLRDLSCLNLGVGSTPVSPHLELRFLRSLKTDDTRLLSCLTLPRLSVLEMLGPIDTAAASALGSLLARSACDLRFLSLRVHKATVPQLQRLLRTASTVVHLTLDRAWLEFQMQALHAADVLPLLERLEIRSHGGHKNKNKGENGDGNQYRALLDMLQWRLALGQGTFKSCKLLQRTMSLGPASDDTMAEFRVLAKAGVQIRVIGDQGTILDTRRPA